MRFTLLLTPFLLICGSAKDVQALSAASPLPALQLTHGWRLQSSAVLDADGDNISTTAFTSTDWYPTSVPSTVLNALTKNGVYPDMRVGLNAYRIPDASDEFNEKHHLAKFSHLPDKRNPWKDPWWYRVEFDIPSAAREERVWLNLDGINYRADVWLNGQKIADKQDVVGVFSRYRFDVTQAAKIGQQNVLAIRTHLSDHPGVPETQLKVLGPRREFQKKEIMKDVAFPMSIGYDCSPPVHDRLMGLIDKVSIEFTGPVDVRHSFVKTTLPLPDTSTARLTVSAELVNATEQPQRGVLAGKIEETGETFQVEVELAAGETKEVTFSPEQHPALIVKNPRLWWPRPYGSQPLYHADLRFDIGGHTSDREKVTFGIRQIDRELHKLDGAHGLRVLVNGRRIFCRGGYLQPEILHDWTTERLETELRYLADANLNALFYFDMAFPPREFLDYCDRHGLLFGNCFYTGFWPMPGTDFPLDTALLARGTEDVIKRIRNHPSIFLYMCMNESDTREDVYLHWRDAIQRLDGTRLSIPSGYFADSRKKVPAWIKPDLPTGINDMQPKTYGWKGPEHFYRMVRDSRNWMFMLESGSASPPSVDSLQRFLPDMFEADPSDRHYPLTPVWAHHGGNEYFVEFYNALCRIFGKPTSVEDFCRKSVPLQAMEHRAMYEAVNHRLWDITSGYSEWCLNSCFPTVQWQVFDWYMRPTASYYYIKRACEPIHVQLSPLDNVVSVINLLDEPLSGAVIHARVYDLDSKLVWEKHAAVDVRPDSYQESFAIEAPADITRSYFVALELTDAAHKPLSENFYWLHKNELEDLRALTDLKRVSLATSMTIDMEAAETVARVRVENTSDTVALFVRLALTQGEGGEEVLPVAWSDNYFCLTPGQSRELTARVANKDLGNYQPTLEFGGWNLLSPFDCRRLVVPPKAVKSGEEFLVEATIARTFLDGSHVELFVDEKPTALETVYARGDKERTIRFPLTLTSHGEHAIRVGNQTAKVIVE